MKIQFKNGDALNPEELQDGNVIIVHCCNNLIPGVMGAGIAAGIRKKWKNVYEEYKSWSQNAPTRDKSTFESGIYRLGEIQLVQAEDNIKVCNLLGQQDVGNFHDLEPVRYDSVEEGLYRLLDWMNSNKNKYYNQIVSPWICCGLAGGKKDIIEDIINHVFEKSKYGWTIYDYVKEQK